MRGRGGQTNTGRKDRRREGGKGGGDRRLVHQIPTMQPWLPGLQKTAAVTQMPWQVCSESADNPELRQAPAGSRSLAWPRSPA